MFRETAWSKRLPGIRALVACAVGVAGCADEHGARHQQPEPEPAMVPVEVCTPGKVLGCASASDYRLCDGAGAEELVISCAEETPHCVGSGECVACVRDRCADRGSLLKCVDGAYRESACPDSQTCIEDADGASCTGSCRAGSYRCNQASKNAEKCIDQGVWQQIDSCDVPTQICRLDAAGAAACALNEPFMLGHLDADSSWNRFEPSNELWALRVVSTKPVTARGLYVSSSMAEGSCDMALYDDSMGKPGNLITQVPGIGLVAGGVGGTIAQRIELKPGTPYWVAATCYGVGSNGTAHLFWTPRAGEVAYWAEYPAGTLPATKFPVGVHVYDRAYGFALAAREIP